jgi:hypothetical protein
MESSGMKMVSQLCECTKNHRAVVYFMCRFKVVKFMLFENKTKQNKKPPQEHNIQHLFEKPCLTPASSREEITPSGPQGEGIK